MVSAVVLGVLVLQSGFTMDYRPGLSNLQKTLQAKVHEFSVSEDTFLQALAKVSAEFEIPMGIECLAPTRSREGVRLTWRDASVREIIASLVTSQPDYDFEITNGAVHVFPKGFATDRRNPLNIHIGDFEVRNEFVEMASRRLRHRVRRILGTLAPPKTGEGYAASMSIGLGDREASFELHNATVRDALDKLIVESDLNLWVVAYAGDPGLTAQGYTRVASLLGAVVPDSEQPVWSILPWGYDPISMRFRDDWKATKPTP